MLLLCAVRRFNDMTVVTVSHSVTGTVVSVKKKEGREYLRSLFGQSNNLTVY